MSGSEIGLSPPLSQQPDRAWAADSTRTLDSGLLGLLPTARQTTPPRNHAVESYALEAFDLVSGFRSFARMISQLSVYAAVDAVRGTKTAAKATGRVGKATAHGVEKAA